MPRVNDNPDFTPDAAAHAVTASTKSATPAAPRAALGRADLLRLLVAWGKGAEYAAAELTGYDYRPPQPSREPVPPAPVSAQPDPPPVPHDPALPPRPRVEHYSATLTTTESMLAGDFQSRLDSIDAAPTPPPLAPPPAPPPAPPAWRPLASERRLVVLAEKHLRSLHNVNQWDVQKLARQLAQGLPPGKRRARQQRLLWRDNALLLQMRRQTEPLHDDYRALAQIVQRRSGGRVPIYLHYQGDGWSVYDPAGDRLAQRALPSLWRDLPQAPSLKGMQGLAVGWPLTARWPDRWQPAALLTAWAGHAAPVAPASADTDDMAAANATTMAMTSPLSPLAAGTHHHPPLVWWDVDSPLHLRRQLPPGTLHTAPRQLAHLLALLTLAVVVHPPLLRALRCLLAAPAAAEVDAWASPDVACNGVAIAVRAVRRPHYSAILAAEVPLAVRRQAAECIAAYHTRLSFEIALEESQHAHSYAPGAQVLAPEQYFAQMARQLRDHPASAQMADSMAYLTRAGHRASRAVWESSPEFNLAWALANPDAILKGIDLPAEFPLALLQPLRQKISALPVARQGIRLHQQDGFLICEVCDIEALPVKPALPVNGLAQWSGATLLKWRGGNAQQWHRMVAAADLPPIDLARHAPVELTDGQTTCIVRHEARPAWALAWGRDRDGLYALAPNPWGAPLRVPYPRAQQPSVRISVMPPVPAPTVKGKPKNKTLPNVNCVIDALTLDLDDTGLIATLTLNGQYTQAFRYINPGQFTIGAPESETAGEIEKGAKPEWFTYEGPQHRVTISEGFWLADTACTQGMWQAVRGDNPSHFTSGNQGGPDHPVEQVSWDMIQPFLQRLEAMLPGCRVTLPTEAEWEYACRAGSDTPFSFGETITTDHVNYNGNSPYGKCEKGEYREHTVAVKELPANGWGLYQMHGNVLEWCADTAREYGFDAVNDPGLAIALAPDFGSAAARVLRGGGWLDGARLARSACRLHLLPDWQGDRTGFRFALRFSSSASVV
jgi:formylglycine-generating enzyme required for sulfatase activity